MVFSSTYSSAAVKLGIRRKMVNGMFHKLKIEKGANLQQKIFYCSVFPDPRKWKFQTSFDGLFSEAKGLYTMAWYPCCGRGLGKRGHKQLEILPFNYGFHLVILHLFSNLLWAVIPWIQILAQLTGWFSVLNVSSSWISPHWLACLLTWLWHQSEDLTSSLHLSRLPWSKARYGMSRKSLWSHRRPCQWAEVWGVRRKWKSNCTGSLWSRGSVDSTVRFPA